MKKTENAPKDIKRTKCLKYITHMYKFDIAYKCVINITKHNRRNK